MKILTYTLFLLLIVSMEAIAQPFGEASPGYRITRQDYKNGSGESGFTTFDYDREGILWRAFWCLNDSSRYSVNQYACSEEGKLITAFRNFSDGSTTYELFSYDGQGQKASETFRRSDGVSGEASYTYEEGRLTSALFKKYKGWLSGKLLISYNARGKKSSAVLLKNDTLIATLSYNYDSAGNMETEYWDFCGKWFQKFSFSYEKTNTRRLYYTSPFVGNLNGYRIKAEDYSYNGEKGGPSLYEYNPDGLLVAKRFIRSDGISTETQYYYDDGGKLSRSVRLFTNGQREEFRYTYDHNENLIFRGCYHNDTLTGYEAWQYTHSGDLISARYVNADGWLTGNLIFSGKDPGSPDHAIFRGDNGLSADITIKRNNDGLTTDINWKFSSGKFQHYHFEYERYPLN